MRYGILLSMTGWFAVGMADIGQAQEPRVGTLGEPGRLAVYGVKSAPPAEVAKALFVDIDVAYASFPDAPLEELKRLLVHKAVLGFQHSGFPTPRVTIADRLDHLELTVDEGPRWLAGEIRVDGVKAVDARKLVSGLLPNRAASASASTQRTSRWLVGQPARLDEPSRQSLSQRVEELLAEQGYIDAQSSVQIVGDHGRHTAALIVSVRNEGEPARVRDIEIEGNKVHTREQIFAWLRLAPDAVLSSEHCNEIAKRLEVSGRFIRCAFYPAAHATKPRLWVKEFTYAPRLDQPLSREEEALLKLSEWMGTFDQQGDDLVFKLDSREGWLEMVFSPDHAFVISIKPPGSSHTSPIPDLAVLCTKDQISILSAKHGRKLAIACAASAFFPRATFALVHHDNGDSAYHFWFVSRESGEDDQAKTGPILTAASALSIVCKHHARCTWDGPILTAQWKNHRLRLDSRDGKLIDLDDSKGLNLFFRAGTKNNWTSKPVAGEFAQRSTELASASSNLTNVADSRRFFSSAAGFICQVLVDHHFVSGGAEKMTTAIGHLSSQGAFRLVDDLFFAQAHYEPHPFLVPTTTAHSNWKFRVDEKGYRHHIKRFAVSWADEMFVRNSRLWLMYREAAFITNGKSEHMRERFGRLFPEGQSGPITTLLLAEAMLLAEMKADAGDWARRGLEQASLDGFRRDYADLLVPGSRFSDYVLTAAAAIRGLDQDQVDALLNQLFEWHWLSRSQMRQAALFTSVLRSDASQPIPATLGAALDVLWKWTLEHVVKERLEVISTPAAAPPNNHEQVKRRGWLFR